MNRIFWTVTNAQGAESSKLIFLNNSMCDVEGITKSDFIAVYFYIRERLKVDIKDISNSLSFDKTKAYLCVMTLFENDFIQPKIEKEGEEEPKINWRKISFDPPQFSKK